MKFRRRLFALGTAGALGLTGVVAGVIASGAQSLASTSAARLKAEAPPPLPRGAVRLGALSPGSRLHLDVTLQPRDPAALSAFAAAVTNPQSPQFRQFLRPGQFGPRFGPSLSAVAAVRGALRAAGLSPGRVSSDRLIIPVTAPAAAVEHAFGISLVRYRLASGRVAYTNLTAPRIPAAAAPYVGGVTGLSNLYQQQNMLARPSRVTVSRADRLTAQPDASGPKPCKAAAGVSFGLTANVLAGHYRMSQLYKLGDLGQNVHVGIFELEPNLGSDISSYESCYGIHTKVTYSNVDGGSGSGAGSGEAALDIEDVASLAPDVTINVYRGPNSESGVLDTYDALISADHDQVITTSWGLCELYTNPSDASSEQTLFSEANAQGQTVFAAVGDFGSTTCLPNGGPDASHLSTGDPASQPGVNGVGGTELTRSGEVVWNESGRNEGAGGGGISQIWCMPPYQFQTAIPGLINAHSTKNGGCPTAQQQYVRQTPDVSADADPQTGYVVRWHSMWLDIGGTSAAAPLWAAAASLIDASPFCRDYGAGDAGVLPQVLYRTVSKNHKYIYAPREEGLFDVIKGNNDYGPSGYHGGLYPAGKGYDEATGLGTPIITGVGARGSASNYYPGLAALMCRAVGKKLTRTKVTGLSSGHGSTKGGQKVTVKGSGFLPISGADVAEVGTTRVPAACSSTTRCVIRMPRHRSGTVDIRISAEDGAFSAKVKADRYRYV